MTDLCKLSYAYADRMLVERYGITLARYGRLDPAEQQQWDAIWCNLVDEYWDNLEDEPSADVQTYGDER